MDASLAAGCRCLDTVGDQDRVPAAESQWGTRLPGGGLLLAPGGAQMYLSSEIVAGTVGRIVMAFVMRGAFTLSGDPDPPDPPHPFTGCWPPSPPAPCCPPGSPGRGKPRMSA